MLKQNLFVFVFKIKNAWNPSCINAKYVVHTSAANAVERIVECRLNATITKQNKTSTSIIIKCNTNKECILSEMKCEKINMW